MINLDQTVFIRADRMGEVFIQGLEEMMGPAGLVAVLKQAGLHRRRKKYLKTGNLERILEAMGVLFGPRAGLGMAQCAGRVCFKYGLRAFGAELGLYDLQFRLQPPAVRIRDGLDLLALLAGRLCGATIQVEQNQSYYRWVVQSNGSVPGGQLDQSVYHLMVGVLRELLYWTSGGQDHFTGSSSDSAVQ